MQVCSSAQSTEGDRDDCLAWRDVAALAGLAEDLMRSCTRYVAITNHCNSRIVVLVASFNKASYLLHPRHHEAVIRAFSSPLK
jgi:hypothetical protein